MFIAKKEKPNQAPEERHERPDILESWLAFGDDRAYAALLLNMGLDFV